MKSTLVILILGCLFVLSACNENQDNPREDATQKNLMNKQNQAVSNQLTPNQE